MITADKLLHFSIMAALELLIDLFHQSYIILHEGNISPVSPAIEEVLILACPGVSGSVKTEAV